jgi:hypothetical protein
MEAAKYGIGVMRLFTCSSYVIPSEPVKLLTLDKFICQETPHADTPKQEQKNKELMCVECPYAPVVTLLALIKVLSPGQSIRQGTPHSDSDNPKE